MKQELHTELFDIRRVVAEDRELFGDVVAAEYLMGKLYKIDPEIANKVYWETIVEDKADINYCVFLKNGDLIGRVALQGIDGSVPELAIVIVNKYQGQGYGVKILKEWLNWVHENMGYNRINVRIDSSNMRSKRLFKKIGTVIDDEGDIIYGHINLPL